MNNSIVRNTKNIIGKKFGILTVLEFSHYKIRNYDKTKRQSCWKCQCACGSIKIITTHSLKNGIKSCGCLPKGAKRKAPGVAGLNALYYRYKYRAKLAKRSFTLSKKFFKDITSQDCHYCGASPNSISASRSTLNNQMSEEGLKNSIYKYNGIDRIDNNKGYISGNVVSCCGECNWLKGTFEYNEFINLIKKISKHLSIIENIV